MAAVAAGPATHWVASAAHHGALCLPRRRQGGIV